MRPMTLEDAIRDVVVCEYGHVDVDEMIEAIANRVRDGFIIPVLHGHGFAVQGVTA